MPLDACVYFWTCPGCETRHSPKQGDCCVFCSYGTLACPPVQQSTPARCSDPSVLRALQVIPGVGKRVSLDLWNLGIRTADDLRDRDAEELYRRLCTLQQAHVDRCMLYTLRCAVYFASNDQHDPELLKWWNWKDVPDAQPVRPR
ncbi:hypothetical protein BH23GEM9_BH23GEM9_07350 [soil metagenome]